MTASDLGPRRAGAWTWWVRGLSALLSLWAAACGADGTFDALSQPGAGGQNGWVTGGGGYSVGACSPEGASRRCEVNLGTHDQVVTCIDGIQTCREGTWSDCEQLTMHHKQLRKDAFPEIAAELGRALRLSDVLDAQGQPQLPHVLDATAVGCMSPCSPSCMEFDETPSGAMVMGTGVGAGNSGSLGGLASGLVNKGWVASGCGSAAECQFGYYCSDPATGILCAHSKCATGSALSMLTPASPGIPLATAHLLPTNTQSCPLGALPAASGAACPVDVFHALDGGQTWGRARDPYLDLLITLNPLPLVAPTLSSFQPTYSCPDAL